MSIQSESPSDALETRRDRAIVHVIESALQVNRRHQFFVWTQGSFQALLPHKLAILGIYDRGSKKVCLEVINSVVVSQPVLALLTDGQSVLMQQIVNAWVGNRCRPLIAQVASLPGRSIGAASETALRAAALGEFLVHGVSRPQRANEIETLFMFATPGTGVAPSQLTYLDLLIPHLHSTYLRVHMNELQILNPRAAPALASAARSKTGISEREVEVLGWAREGLSNLEIGSKLAISPLTVKNHIQKILRKLGAANRAQAVARAMSLNLLERSPYDGQAGSGSGRVNGHDRT